VPRIDVGANFVVAAVEVLNEGVPCGRSRDFQAAVICFDRIVPVLLGDLTRGRQQLVQYARVGT
jgi:hypothetical protein